MHRYSNTAKLLRWSAWTSGTVVALFLLYMLIGHLVGEANGQDPWTFGSTRDLLSFLLFPLLTLIGLLLAYRWMVIGGTLLHSDHRAPAADPSRSAAVTDTRGRDPRSALSALRLVHAESKTCTRTLN